MKIDRYKLSVKGFTIELDGELDREQLTNVLVETSITDVSTPANEDGTYNKVYKAKLFGGSQVAQSGRTPIKGKDRRGLSKRLRGALFYKAGEDGIETEEAYEGFMKWLIKNIDTIWQMYLTHKK